MFNFVYQIPYIKKQGKKKKESDFSHVLLFLEESELFDKRKKKCLTHISSPTSEAFHFQRHQIVYHIFPFAKK